MKIYNNLLLEAEERLDDLDQEVEKIKDNVSQVKRVVSRAAVISVIIIPIALSFTIVRRLFFKKESLPLNQAKKLPVVPFVTKELIMFVLSELVIRFFKKSK